jgi:hypothetical protein
MARGGEAAHVDTDLGDDHLGGDAADPDDLPQPVGRGREQGDLGLDVDLQRGDGGSARSGLASVTRRPRSTSDGRHRAATLSEKAQGRAVIPSVGQVAAAGSGPLASSVSATRRASSLRVPGGSRRAHPRGDGSRPAGRGRGTRPAGRAGAARTRPAPCGAARPSTPTPAARQGPHHLRQRQWPLAGRLVGDGSATPAVGNSRPKPTSSTNAPARPMLRIGRPTCHQRRARLAQGHPCRDCTTSRDGQTSVDQAHVVVLDIRYEPASHRHQRCRGRQRPADGAERRPAGPATAPRWR